MSGTCRDTYYNYGSYLRSRGTDKAVCELNSKIIANTAAIAKNAAAIAVNTLDISANTSAIAVNTLDISANTSAIAVNTLDISANTSAIAVNTLDISANTSAIAVNTLDISANTSAIAVNTLDISANTSAIAVNTLDISANTSAIIDISNIISNYDISFTTIDLSATNLDVSNNVNFTKNPIVTNDASYNNRVLRNYSESTSVLDISAIGIFSATLHDLSLNIPTIYSDLDPNVLTGANPIFTTDFIDFSNNQGYFKDSLMEVYVSAKVSFELNQTESISFVFDNVAGSSEILLDTRSINETGVVKTLCFGPQMFVFNDSSPESSFIEDQWRVGIDICGGDVKILENPRMVIKQKSLV